MRQIIVSIHRVQTTVYDVNEDFDHDGDLDAQLDWDYLSARLHEDTHITGNPHTGHHAGRRRPVMTMQTLSRIDRLTEALGADLDVERVLATAERDGITALLPGDEHWPAALDALGTDAPSMLWGRGPPPS